ncbi:hypothetical protein [Spirillospora sp. NPDC029432]|uniref:hypothetical protein n=1 Tax=Spirillospora sp. NPDC029432 TaxID=3154599 RepID=UPI0034543588
MRIENGEPVLRYGLSVRIALIVLVLVPFGMLVLYDVANRRTPTVFYSVLLAPLAFLVLRESLRRVTVNEDGITFPVRAHFWQLRPVSVPWGQITAFGAFGRRGEAGLPRGRAPFR